MSDQSININLNDIMSCVAIIDLVSTRGAFKGSELSSIGILRDKLVKFIDENKPKDEKNNSEQSTEE